jgi:hypothetical protein
MRDLARQIGGGETRDEQRDEHDHGRVLDDVLSTLGQQGADGRAPYAGWSSRPALRSHLIHRQLAST